MFDPMFVPPRHHPGLFWFASTFVPQLGKLFGNVHGLSADEATLARVRELKGRALVCPNHPTETDPIVVFWLARAAGQRFNFLATRETLDGPRGYLLNRIGVYSVIRGFPDRESIRCTRRLLAEEDRRVVIFPEGLVYEHNDKLLEFQNGVAQMGFWALDDLHKSGKDPALPILPLAIRYRCKVDPRPYIERGLSAVEEKLGLSGASKAGIYERLLRAGGEVLSDLERAEGIKPQPDQPLGERIAAVRRHVLERVAQAAGAELDDDEPPGEQLHRITNELRAWVGTLPDEHSEYEERLYRQRATTAAPLFAELVRLHNFVALSGDYVASEPTAERFLEVLGRLQKEVLGKVPYCAPLRAIVRAGDPIRLDERYPEYRERKREVVAQVTDQLEDCIRAMLQDLRHEATPL